MVSAFKESFLRKEEVIDTKLALANTEGNFMGEDHLTGSSRIHLVSLWSNTAQCRLCEIGKD